MRLAAPASPRQLDLGLAVLRIVGGIVFAAHGAQKLFVYGLDGVAGGFAQMGIPLAGVVGPAVGVIELLGGIALVLGLLTRPFAIGLAAVMLGALFSVHLAAGFFLPNGYEFVFALFGAAATLAITGAGRLSLDARLFGRGVGPSADRSLRRAA